jgi:hypothetical protein
MWPRSLPGSSSASHRFLLWATTMIPAGGRDRVGSSAARPPLLDWKITTGIASQPKLSAPFPKATVAGARPSPIRRCHLGLLASLFPCQSQVKWTQQPPAHPIRWVGCYPSFRFAYSTLTASSSSLWPSFDRNPHTLFMETIIFFDRKNCGDPHSD